MKDRRSWLIGTWETCDEDSRIVLEISETKRGFKVRAFDKNDGEEFVVSGTRWDGKALIFQTYVRSCNWRTGNRLTPISKSRFRQELTFWETWRKVETTIHVTKTEATSRHRS